MPTNFTCPKCLWHASPKRQIPTGAKIRCSHCQTVILTPDLGLDPSPVTEQAKVIQPKPKKGGSEDLPLYKDTILRWAWILPAVISGPFLCYLAWESNRSHHRQTIAAMGKEAEQLAAKQENRSAYEKYQANLAYIGGSEPGSDELRHTVEVARSESDRLLTVIEQV